MRKHGVEVVHFAAARVVAALALAHASEIGPPALVAKLDEGSRKGLHHFVVERAAELRMRMRDQRLATRIRLRRIDGALDPSRRSRDELAAGAGTHPARTSSGVLRSARAGGALR